MVQDINLQLIKEMKLKVKPFNEWQIELVTKELEIKIARYASFSIKCAKIKNNKEITTSRQPSHFTGKKTKAQRSKVLGQALFLLHGRADTRKLCPAFWANNGLLIAPCWEVKQT